MARNIQNFCTSCRTENIGEAVLQRDNGSTKDWHWVCSGCNTVSELTEIVKEPYIPKQRISTRERFPADDEQPSDIF